MALMTVIRQKMHIFLWALLVMFLLSMTVGGLVGGANIIDQLIGRVDPSKAIAQVNGENITPNRFNSIVNQQLETLRARNQQINDNEIGKARKTAWDNMLQDILVSQEVERLNISASDEEVLFYLENSPPPFLTQNPSFQTDGKFDSEKFKDALTNPQGDEWTPIEFFMKNTYIPNFKLQKMLDQSIVISEEELKDEFIKRNTKFDIEGIFLSNNRFNSDDIQPNEKQVLDQYEQNQDLYKHDELRNIRSLSWEKKPSQADSLKVFEVANKVYIEAKSGSNFKDLANRYSEDPGNQNGTKGGDLGWFKKGRMVKEFDEAAFNASKNEIISPLKTQFGFHIIFIRDLRFDKNGEKEILASHILFKVDPSDETLKNLKKEAILFSYEAQDNGFDIALRTTSKEPNNHNKITMNSYSIDILGPLRSAVRFSFNNELNSVSDMFENNKYFAVFTIDEIIKPGVKPIDDVKLQIKQKLIEKEKKNLNLNQANELLIQFSSGDLTFSRALEKDKSLEKIANKEQTLNRGFNKYGRSNFVNGALLNANQGDLLGPLEMRTGYVIIQVNEVETFDSIRFNEQRQSIYQNIFNQKQNQFFKSWLDDLKANSKIIDNRKYYF